MPIRRHLQPYIIMHSLKVSISYRVTDTGLGLLQKLQNVDMRNIASQWKNAEFRLFDVRVAQNLQNMLHLVEKTDNTECLFLGKKLPFLKQIRWNLPPKNKTESDIGRCRVVQNLQNLSFF